MKYKFQFSAFWTLGLVYLLTFYESRAQQDPSFGHFQLIKSYVNPAETGLNEISKFAFIYRSQWTGLKSSDNGISGVPVAQYLMGETQLNGLNSGIGAYLVNDVLGAQRSITSMINYAYHLKLDGEKTLSMGFGMGVYNISYDVSLFRAVNDADPLKSYLSNFNKTAPNLNIGLSYNTHRYYLGISSFHINKPQITNAVKSDSAAFLQRSYYLTGGYLLNLTDLISLTPSFLLRSNLSPISTTNLELRALGSYNKDQFFGGLTFRAGDAIGILLGASLFKNSSLKISYAFDLTYVGTNAKSSTSNEVYICFSTPKSKLIPKPIIRTPRYRF